ncbi:1-aminocyclopropane-1-carboxylate oxidase4 [Sesamum alatum]|uniref:1-aminocyclopropane-1-carboxylate oxidase4 n=1 Tax=Sesamum alatum TaxID=300844 RepID=A0AAE2CER5_9LAMI|nr:1-aminocyclopropane-1-carboxylate oxidase4 [Sesamum alatum]
MATSALSAMYDRMKEVQEFDQSKAGVKGLSDSGVSTIPRIFIHPPESLSGLRNPSSSSVQIPLIDLSHADSNPHPPEIVQKIRDAAKTWGFFQVINHGIPVSALDQTISAIKSFHEQPKEAKSKFYSREEKRGVMYASNNDLYRSRAASWHDTLQVWLAGPAAASVEEIPEICRNEVVEWNEHVKNAAEKVMELLALGLGLDAGKFRELSFSGERVMVAHIYPYCPQPDLTLGITAHTDPGIITVLLQNEIQGLQVKHGDEWVDVKPVPGGLIVNIGDFLQIVSNGEYKSIQHRVLANGCKQPRISIVTFFNLLRWPESDRYGPLQELLTPEKPAIYRDFSRQEFLNNFYGKELDSKSLIEKIKL